MNFCVTGLVLSNGVVRMRIVIFLFRQNALCVYSCHAHSICMFRTPSCLHERFIGVSLTQNGSVLLDVFFLIILGTNCVRKFNKHQSASVRHMSVYQSVGGYTYLIFPPVVLISTADVLLCACH